MRCQFACMVGAIAFLGGSLLVLAAPRPASGGEIVGKVTYTGVPPKMKIIDMSKEPGCAKEHAADPLHYETMVTGPTNSLEWVVVYISAGDKGSAAASQTVRYDQKGCQYIPHVAVMQANQPLEIFNNDGWAHNIHPMPKLNAEWNKSQPPGAPPIQTKWDKVEFIPVKCNIHPWMHGYFAVLNTSHYSVTDKDGNFIIKGLPPGKYTVTAWQEDAGSQSQEVTISGSESKTLNFVFKVLPY